MTSIDPNENIVQLADLQAGDILLCIGQGPRADLVASITKSKYTHAAICYSDAIIADIGDQVQKTPTDVFIKLFRYIAVFRSPDFWPPPRVDALRAFIDSKANSDTKYDQKAARSLMTRQRTHHVKSFKNLTDHFTIGLSAAPYNKTNYICSELVIAALISVGLWDEAMAIVYQGDTIHPGNMGHDPTFGFRLGYLRADPKTVIPKDDEFACSPTNSMTIAEWNEAQKQMPEVSSLPEQTLTPQEIQWLLQADDATTNNTPPP